MSFNQFPQAPIVPTGVQVNAYTSDGKPISSELYQTQQPSLGANFSGLIGNKVMVPTVPIGETPITETSSKKKKKTKKSNDDGEIVVSTKEDVVQGPVNSRDIVENTVYADTYLDTNSLTYGVIGQTDELLRDCKQELDYIRSQRNMKGKYHYMNSTITSMSSLLSTKLAAIKEINNTIKTVNDNEYRRFKDMRALDSTDDNKYIMDAYSAFISAPVGAPEYHLPGTVNLTGGLNGIVRADYPADVQKGMDIGMANYLANLTPEENLMLQDSNKDIEEVLVYDQATGAKKFQWMNTRTGEIIANMPPSSDLVLEDFVIDPRTKLAKNTNLNIIKKVVTLNDNNFNNF